MGFKPSPEQIRSWVAANFPEYKERKGGEQLIIPSPFYDNDKYKFNISTSRAVCNDWRGNDYWAGGGSTSFIRFVQLYKNCSFKDAVRDICGSDVSLAAIYTKIKKDREQKEEVDEREVKLELPEGAQQILKSNYPKMAGAVKKWLSSRGIDESLIEKYDLYHIADNVVWPYYEYGMMVYWQSRSILNKFFEFPPESVGVTKGMYLYGFDLIEPSEYVIVTEAIIDMMTIDEQCVATGGATFTAQQERKIHALNPKKGIILAPDNDKAGIDSILHNYKVLNNYKLYYVIPPTRDGIKDWNDLGLRIGKDGVRKFIEKNARPLTSHEIYHLSSLSL